MKDQIMKPTLPTIVLPLLLTVIAASALDTARLEQLTGLKGALNQEEGVFKLSSPRTDVKVSVDGWTMPPFMGLTSWAAFKDGMNEKTMVMGDIVLLQDEVSPAMSAALDAGLSVTALHNHFFYDEPKVYFMHIGGEGTPDKLAEAVKQVLDSIKSVRSSHASPSRTFGAQPLPAESSISPAPIAQILGSKPQTNNGMVKVVLGRTVKMPCGCDAGKEMGVNTWAAFAGADDNAVVDGDFVVLGEELQAALKSLRKSGINIVAIHHHMIGEEPRMIFFHYWGRGPAKDLANAVKSALTTTKTEKKP